MMPGEGTLVVQGGFAQEFLLVVDAAARRTSLMPRLCHRHGGRGVIVGEVVLPGEGEIGIEGEPLAQVDAHPGNQVQVPFVRPVGHLGGKKVGVVENHALLVVEGIFVPDAVLVENGGDEDRGAAVSALHLGAGTVRVPVQYVETQAQGDVFVELAVHVEPCGVAGEILPDHYAAVVVVASGGGDVSVLGASRYGYVLVVVDTPLAEHVDPVRAFSHQGGIPVGVGGIGPLRSGGDGTRVGEADHIVPCGIFLTVHEVELAGDVRETRRTLDGHLVIGVLVLLLVGRHQDDAVCSAATVDCGGAYVLQHGNCHDIRRVELVQAAHGILHAVHHYQRVVARRDGTRTADLDAGALAGFAASGHDFSSGDTALEGLGYGSGRSLLQVFHCHDRHRAGEVALAGSAVTHCHCALKLGGFRLELYVQRVAPLHVDELGGVAQEGEFQDCIRGNRYIVPSVHVGHDSVLGIGLVQNPGGDDGLAAFIGHDTCHFYILRHQRHWRQQAENEGEYSQFLHIRQYLTVISIALWAIPATGASSTLTMVAAFHSEEDA